MILRCIKCQEDFSTRVTINGERVSIAGRKLCLKCSPYKQRAIHKCQKCGEQFGNYVIINGKTRNLHNRRYCLTRSPFGGKNTQKLSCPIDYETPRTCRCCGGSYIYDRKKGHRTDICGNCKCNERNLKNKDRAIAYKGGKCVSCGYDKCRRSLHFHHVILENKKFSIGTNSYRRWDTMKQELDKCILVCGNCHGELHDGIQRIENIVCVKDYEQFL